MGQGRCDLGRTGAVLSQPYKTPGTQKKAYFQIQKQVSIWIHMKQYILQVQGCCLVWGFMALNPETQKQ